MEVDLANLSMWLGKDEYPKSYVAVAREVNTEAESLRFEGFINRTSRIGWDRWVCK